MITTPTNTWIALAAGLASEPTNWSLGRAPITGDTVVFDNTSDNNCSWDLDKLTVTPDGTVLDTGYDGTVAQGSVDMGFGPSGYTQRAGVFTANSAKEDSCDGDFVTTGGALTNNLIFLRMTRAGSTINTYNAAYFVKVTAAASITIATTAAYGVAPWKIDVAAGCVVTVAQSATFTYRYDDNSSTYSNAGEIDGAGTLAIRRDGDMGEATLTLGTVNARVYIYKRSSASASGSVTLGAGAVMGSTFLMESQHATYTLTLNHGSNYSLTVAGLTTLGARAVMIQGTAQWSFNGGYTQNGASSVFNQGGPVVVNGATAISDGTLNAASLKTWTQSVSFSHTGGVIKPDSLNLILIDGALLNLVSVLWSVTFQGACTCSVAADKFTRNFVNTGVLVISTEINVGLTSSTLTVLNTGIVVGALKIWAYGSNATICPGIGNNTQLLARAAATGNTILSLGAEASGITTVQSAHASYTITFDTAGFALSHRGLTVGVRGAVKLGSSKVLSYGNTDTSAGSADFGTSQYVQAGPGTIKLAANQPFNDLIFRGASVGSKLLSDVTVNGIYAHVGPVDTNGFALTYNATKEYDGARVPMIKQFVRPFIIAPEDLNIIDLEVPG